MSKAKSPPPVVESDPLPPRTQLAGLIGDVRTLAQAEWDYARARLSYSGTVAKQAGIFALLAILALSGSAIALILGTLLILASYWGPWIATLITVLFFLIVALLSALRARSVAKQFGFGEIDHAAD